MGFPSWTAYPVTIAELAAGAALIIGWNARWVSPALTPVLIGAAITHWPQTVGFTSAPAVAGSIRYF